MKRIFTLGIALLAMQWSTQAQNNTFREPGLTYGLPGVFQNTKGEVVLSWTERAENGNVDFVFSISKDGGKSYASKQVIYSSPQIGTGRLARPRLLFKKNGDMIAVFTINPDAQLVTPGEKISGRPKNLQLFTTTSTDGGKSWSTPNALHSDLEPKIRGFFDAILMANDELAVVFLKDIPNRPHERDLRIITTVNGKAQEETVIDPFVCDCCNLGLLTDSKGKLNVYFRENQDDLRDISKMESTDNGKSFASQQWVHRDNWKVNACPHNGPQAIRHGNTNLIAYYSGKSGSEGVKLVNEEGKLLSQINHESVKMATLVGADKRAVILYAQKDDNQNTKIGYRDIVAEKVSKDKWVSQSTGGANPNGLIIGKQLLLAYEIIEKGVAVGIKTEMIKL